MTDTEGMIFVYAMITLGVAMLSYVVRGVGYSRKLGARLALTCWAWPIWVIIAFVKVLIQLGKESEWFTRKGRE